MHARLNMYSQARLQYATVQQSIHVQPNTVTVCTSTARYTCTAELLSYGKRFWLINMQEDDKARKYANMFESCREPIQTITLVVAGNFYSDLNAYLGEPKLSHSVKERNV